MKRKLFYLCTVICLAVCFTSCDKGDDSKQPDNTNVFTGYDKEKLNHKIFADETGAVSDFAFTAAEAWSISIGDVTKSTTNNSWVTVDPMSGDAGSHTINIKLDLNYTGEDRIAKINITAGESTITITVEQKGTTAENEKPVPAPKVITSYMAEYPSETEDVVFKYDDQWRLIELQITDTDNGQLSSGAESYYITYNSDGFISKWSNEGEADTYTYTFNDKDFANKKVTDRKDAYYSKTTESIYTYNDEMYLTKINEKSNDSQNQTNRFEALFTWTNGNITKVVDTDTYSDGNTDGTDYVKTTTFLHTTYEDKSNMDISLFTCNVGNIAFDHAALTRKLGKSNKNLMDKAKSTAISNDGRYEKTIETTYTYTYTMDDSGYPTQIVETMMIVETKIDSQLEEEDIVIVSDPAISTYTIIYNK